MDLVDSSKTLDPTMKGSFNTDMFMVKEQKSLKHLILTLGNTTKVVKKELGFCKKLTETRLTAHGSKEKCTGLEKFTL